MIEESLQEQAALYASGVLSAHEREQFESTLEFHRGLPELVADLEEISAALVVATLPALPPQPSAELAARLLRRLRGRPQRGARDVTSRESGGSGESERAGANGISE
jgi:anti-sigma-K factor RskA